MAGLTENKTKPSSWGLAELDKNNTYNYIGYITQSLGAKIKQIYCGKNKMTEYQNSEHTRTKFRQYLND